MSLGTRVLAGAFGKLWVDGREVMTVKDVNIDITIDREEVLLGLGKDSKIVSLTGSGNFTVEKIESFGMTYLKSFIKGKDLRMKLTLQMKDPDTEGEQLERFTIDGAWIDSMKMGSFSRGAKVEDDFPFGFNVAEAIGFEDMIN